MEVGRRADLGSVFESKFQPRVSQMNCRTCFHRGQSRSKNIRSFRNRAGVICDIYSIPHLIGKLRLILFRVRAQFYALTVNSQQTTINSTATLSSLKLFRNPPKKMICPPRGVEHFPLDNLLEALMDNIRGTGIHVSVVEVKLPQPLKWYAPFGKAKWQKGLMRSIMRCSVPHFLQFFCSMVPRFVTLIANADAAKMFSLLSGAKEKKKLILCRRIRVLKTLHTNCF